MCYLCDNNSQILSREDKKNERVSTIKIIGRVGLAISTIVFLLLAKTIM